MTNEEELERSVGVVRHYLPDFERRVDSYEHDLQVAHPPTQLVIDRAKQILHTLENRLYSQHGGGPVTSERHVFHLQRLGELVSTCKERIAIGNTDTTIGAPPRELVRGLSVWLQEVENDQ